ncbi:MAG: restriction endonuclease subunit S [Pseudomonadota bacterium]
MSFPTYPNYKDSGVEWLGEVPEHWQALALSRVLAAPVTDGPHTTPEFLDDGIPFLSVDGIQDGKLYFEGCRYVSIEDHKEFSKKAEPKYNDLLMGKAASIGKIARVTENIEFSIWSPLALIRVTEKHCRPEFLEFCLKSSELQHQILLASNSNTQLNIGMKDIPKLRIPLPAVQDQNQIVRFLDHETARIDALIEEQQRLIELLKEKRQAVISHAVTKGLDPTVPMKDSGVEWLGEVPAHWEVLATKRFFRMVVDPAPDSNDFELLSVYTEIGVRPRKDLEQKGNKASTTDGYWQVKKGDIIVNKLLAWMGAVGYSDYEGVTSPAYDILRPTRKLSPKLFHYIFRGKSAQQEFKRWSRGIMEMRLRLYFDELGRISMPFPPPCEQERIVEFIEILECKFDALSQAASEQIQLLSERRSALISATVTGKIDVRGWKPPASAKVQELEEETM